MAIAAVQTQTPIPGPRSYPVIGNIPQIDAKASLGSFERIAREHGEIYRLNVPGTRLVIVSTHALVDEISDEKRFIKTPNNVLNEIRAGVGDGLFTAWQEEPNWGIAHRVLMPAFGPTGIRDMFDEMHDVASQLVLKWARQGATQRIHVTDDFTRLALDTLALCSMGFRFNNFYTEKAHPFVSAMGQFLTECGKRTQRLPLPGMFYKSDNNMFERDIEILRSTAQAVLDERVAGHGADRKDLLGAMLKGRDSQTGEKMTDTSIINNLITFLIAGHETTSGTLAYAMFNLLRNPEAYKKMQKEIDDVVGKGPITVEHMQRLPYIEAVLRETLRLQSPIPILSRTALEDNTLLGGKYRVSKDDTLLMLLTQSHNDPKVYPEPEKFKPERMHGENFRNLPKNAWKPFGSGMRACIGRPFAWQESILAMAMIFQKFDFELDDPNYKLYHDQTLTIKPKDLYVKAKLRHGVDATELAAELSGTMNGHMNSRKAEASPRTSHESPGQSVTEGSDERLSPITVLYGSNSGTCESMAQSFALDAPAHGYRVTRLETMDRAVDKLPTDQPVVIVTTSYEGQPADNAAKFVPWLESLAETGQQKLKGVKYAVFGCGSSEWPQTFHRIPILVNEALNKAGAQSLVELGTTDASKDDIFNVFEGWKDKALWPVLASANTSSSSAATGHQSTKKNLIPSLQVREPNTRSTLLGMDLQVARVVEARSLTAPSQPEKRHLTVSLSAGATYRPGDYLTVLPINQPTNVQRALRRFDIARDAIVTIQGTGTRIPTNTGIPVHSILSDLVELNQPATRKDLQTLSKIIDDEDDEVAKLSPPEKESAKETLSTLLSLPPTTRLPPLLTLLEDKFPTLPVPLGTFLAMVPSMRLRQYSISSSPLSSSSSSTATITYSLIPSTHGGVATSYLSTLQPGDLLRVSVRPGPDAFHLPQEDDTPVVMISAGTGLAPFRGFVQHRAASSKKEKKAKWILYHGCRTEGEDDIYSDEFSAWEKEGLVEVRRVYSRPKDTDKNKKQYVQDRIWEDREELLGLWRGGEARFYICGSKGLADGVGEVARRFKGEVYMRENEGKEMEEEGLRVWWEEGKNRRYAVDVFD